MLLFSATAKALTMDWGTISTPIKETQCFEFPQYDVTSYFTPSYAFSLEGSAATTYNVSFALGACRTGCGSPAFS